MAQAGEQVPGEPVSLRSLCGVFFRIGLSSFGGGTGGWIHRETVVLRKWLTHEDFMAGLALGQILPGANVSNLAVYVGERLRGALGATLALSALLAGPFVMILAMAQLSALMAGQPLFHAAMDGIAAAAVGLVLNIGVIGARRFFPKLAPTAIAFATFLAVGVFHWPLFLTVAAIAPVSVAIAYVRPLVP